MTPSAFVMNPIRLITPKSILITYSLVTRRRKTEIKIKTKADKGTKIKTNKEKIKVGLGNEVAIRRN